jgi:hypothetical protein
MGTLYELMICYTIRYIYYIIFISIYILYLYSEHLHQTIGKMRFQSLRFFGINIVTSWRLAIPKNWHPRAPGRTFEPFWKTKHWKTMKKHAETGHWRGGSMSDLTWASYVHHFSLSIGLDFAPGFLCKNRQLEWYIRDRHLFSSFGGSWCSTATLIFRVVDCTRYNFSISTHLGKS